MDLLHNQVHKARLIGAAAERGLRVLRSMMGADPAAHSSTAHSVTEVLGVLELPVAVKIVPLMVDADSYDSKSLQVLRQEVHVSG